MAAALSRAENLQQLMTCAVCLDTLTKPVIFPCVHHFCKACKEELKGVVENGIDGVLCPTCRQFTSNETIKDNFVMEQLVDLHTNTPEDVDTGHKVCDICLKNSCTHKCLECKISICTNCQLGHLRIPSCKGHTVTEIANTDDEKVINEKVINTIVFCTEHSDKIIEFSCVECNQAMCYKCKILKHDKHSTTTIEDAIRGLLLGTETRLKPIKDDIAFLQTEKELQDKLSNETEDKRTNLTRQVESKREELLEKVNKDADSLLSEIKRTHEAKCKKISTNKSSIMQQLSSRESIIAYTDTVLKNFQDVNLLLQLQGDLTSTLDDFQGKTTKINISEISELNLKFCEKTHTSNLLGSFDSSHTSEVVELSTAQDTFGTEFVTFPAQTIHASLSGSSAKSTSAQGTSFSYTAAGFYETTFPAQPTLAKPSVAPVTGFSRSAAGYNEMTFPAQTIHASLSCSSAKSTSAQGTSFSNAAAGCNEATFPAQPTLAKPSVAPVTGFSRSAAGYNEMTFPAQTIHASLSCSSAKSTSAQGTSFSNAAAGCNEATFPAQPTLAKPSVAPVTGFSRSAAGYNEMTFPAQTIHASLSCISAKSTSAQGTSFSNAAAGCNEATFPAQPTLAKPSVAPVTGFSRSAAGYNEMTFPAQTIHASPFQLYTKRQLSKSAKSTDPKPCLQNSDIPEYKRKR